MNSLIAFLTKFPPIILILLAASSTIMGDFFGKYWSLHPGRQIFFILALLGYLGSGLLYTPVLLKQGLVISSILWSVLTTVGFITIGVIVFHESLNLWQTIGVTLGIVSLLILTIV